MPRQLTWLPGRFYEEETGHYIYLGEHTQGGASALMLFAKPMISPQSSAAEIAKHMREAEAILNSVPFKFELADASAFAQAPPDTAEKLLSALDVAKLRGAFQTIMDNPAVQQPLDLDSYPEAAQPEQFGLLLRTAANATIHSYFLFFIFGEFIVGEFIIHF